MLRVMNVVVVVYFLFFSITFTGKVLPIVGTYIYANYKFDSYISLWILR